MGFTPAERRYLAIYAQMVINPEMTTTEARVAAGVSPVNPGSAYRIRTKHNLPSVRLAGHRGPQNIEAARARLEELGFLPKVEPAPVVEAEPAPVVDFASLDSRTLDGVCLYVAMAQDLRLDVKKARRSLKIKASNTAAQERIRSARRRFDLPAVRGCPTTQMAINAQKGLERLRDLGYLFEDDRTGEVVRRATPTPAPVSKPTPPGLTALLTQAEAKRQALAEFGAGTREMREALAKRDAEAQAMRRALAEVESQISAQLDAIRRTLITVTR